MTLAPTPSIPVQSSLLARVGYYAGESILQLEFRDGALYQYFGVPAALYNSLLAAESKGAYFNSQIRRHFRYSLVSRPR